MRTAVTIPDEIFETAERLARRMKKSRSELYSRALSEYMARHSSDDVTAAMNAALNEIDDPSDNFVRAAARVALERAAW
jgi:metal-responsive CopG/Arc/MetJ family transcriptional regulator